MKNWEMIVTETNTVKVYFEAPADWTATDIADHIRSNGDIQCSTYICEHDRSDTLVENENRYHFNTLKEDN